MSAFQDRVREAVQNDHLHVAIERATSALKGRRQVALDSIPDFEQVRDFGRAVKLATIARLDEHLVRFEEKLLQNGFQVHWAEDGEQARQIVLDIARRRDAKSVVKAKSMATEEIHLNAALEEAGLDVLETDLGEYIAQLAGQPPSHIILPILHMTREDVGQVLHDRLGVPLTDDPQVMAKTARETLRAKFLEADLGITGANFGVVEEGAICLVSNEGNIRLTTSLPKVHVAIMGIEKLVPTLSDLEKMLRLLARSATGQKLTAYTSLVRGPKRSPEDEGPEEVHLILLDNGRSKILAGDQAEILACIRCGACLNICPVYKQIGGHAYGDTYPGPIGSIVTPGIRGLKTTSELPQASSLCGACRDICPVRLDIPRMLLSLRRESQTEAPPSLFWRMSMRAFAFFATRPAWYRTVRPIGRFVMRRLASEGWLSSGLGPLGAWTKERDFQAPARRSFQEEWRARQKEAGR
ncbi:MAG: LutB/LldF family L-lactate oxidation iron-sulfur protein [Planctomycetota bacterium]